MKLRLIVIFLAIANLSLGQTSPSTGACPPASCSDLYSASYFDPSTLIADQSLGCNGCGPLSQFQVFDNISSSTTLTCVCYQARPTSNLGFTVSTTHMINVYSFNSADAINIANISSSPPVSSGSYTIDGSEADGDLLCVTLDVPSELSPGDDAFIVEFLDPQGLFYQGNVPSGPGGSVTYGYSPSAGVFELTPISDLGLDNDLLLEVNGCNDAIAVPTLSQWGIIILALLIIIFGVVSVISKLQSAQVS